MAIFHFTIENGERHESDGIELADRGAARAQLVRLCADTLKDDPAQLWDQGNYHFTVATEKGLVLFQIIVVGTSAAASGHR